MAQSVKFQLRRDTATNWAGNNPVLSLGEPGYAVPDGTTGGNRMKIGNGSTGWNSLPYVDCGTTGATGPTGPTGVTGPTGPTGTAGQASWTAQLIGNVLQSPTRAGTFIKTGATGWDSSVRSVQSFSDGAYVSFVGTTGPNLVGLNDTVRTPSGSSGDITYSIQLNSNPKTMVLYQNGSIVPITGLSGWTGGDIFAVKYDGTNVRYYQNGAVIGTPVPRTIGLPLFLDSQFRDNNTQLDNLVFGAGGGGTVGATGPTGIGVTGPTGSEIQLVSQRMVAVGSGGNTILTSTDGLGWTGVASGGFTGGGNGVAWNGSRWVAVGAGNNAAGSILSSTDGLNWTNATSGGFASFSGRAVAWNGSRWVAVGAGSGTASIQTSTDGLNWTVATSGGFTGGGNDVAWNGSRWVAVGGNGPATDNILTSTDGLGWTGVSGTFGNQGFGVAWNGSRWVAVGSVSGPTGGILTSTDGIGWTGPNSGGFSSGGYGESVAWNGSRWVAVGFGSGTSSILTSTDGLNWTAATSGGFSTTGSGVAWNGSRWVAVGNSPSILTSTDGLGWTGTGISGSTFSTYGLGIASNNVWITTPANSQDAMNKFLQNYYVRFGLI